MNNNNEVNGCCWFFFVNNSCKFGDKCKFSHILPAGMTKEEVTKTIICPCYIKGTCAYGMFCKLLHADASATAWLASNSVNNRNIGNLKDNNNQLKKYEVHNAASNYNNNQLENMKSIMQPQNIIIINWKNMKFITQP